jgi:hypothetical protein
MFELKTLSKAAIPGALARAERYRLLNEPWQAESICRDILAAEPDNHEALVMLLLALTDQFEHGSSDVMEARKLVACFRSEYDRAYYAGIVAERRGRALFRGKGPQAGFIAYDAIREAMDCYEKAEALRPPGNDEALLRWNTCARFIMRNPELAPQVQEAGAPLMLE